MQTKSQIVMRRRLLGTWGVAFAIALVLLMGRNANAGPKTVNASLPSLSQQQREARLTHARELLGGTYKRSVVRHGQDVKKINGFVYRWVKDALPSKHRKKYQKVAQTIIDESLKHSFDPAFLIAVIQRESSFNPDAKGSLDEIGLMQLRPETARWIAGKEGIKFKGPSTLKDPISNIRIGAAYLSLLREKFDSHARLYLAAYNMGQTKVRSKVRDDVWPKEYPIAVMQNYVEFYTQVKNNAEKPSKPEKKAVERLTASSSGAESSAEPLAESMTGSLNATEAESAP